MTLKAPLEVTSALLGAPRKVWVQPPISAGASDCLIFLDGELYIERVKAPGIVRDLQMARGLRPVASIYVSHLETAARHADFTCNESYSSFLATDLRRWIAENAGKYERTFLCGLSLSGLMAAFAVLRHPAVFSGALCQSPSAWWNDEWLAGSVARDGTRRSRFWISVGNGELQEGVSHPPTGLFQKTSQLASVRNLVERLIASGSRVRFNEFCGGHDPACWAGELPRAVAWLIENA